MIWYICGALIALALGAWLARGVAEYKRWEGYRRPSLVKFMGYAQGFIWKPILALAAWVLVGGVLMAISSGVGEYERVGDEKYPLAALRTTTEQEGAVAGSVFLTVGYSGSNREISYVRGNGDGGFVVKQVDADSSAIYESDSGDPNVVIYDWAKENAWLVPTQVATAQTFVFTVPTGTVVNQFDVSP